MTVKTRQVALSTTRALLSVDVDVAGTSASLIEVSADVAMFIGGDDVTPSNGRPVAAGGSFSTPLQRGEALYGVLASGTGTAYVFRSDI